MPPIDRDLARDPGGRVSRLGIRFYIGVGSSDAVADQLAAILVELGSLRAEVRELKTAVGVGQVGGHVFPCHDVRCHTDAGDGAPSQPGGEAPAPVPAPALHLVPTPEALAAARETGRRLALERLQRIAKKAIEEKD